MNFRSMLCAHKLLTPSPRLRSVHIDGILMNHTDFLFDVDIENRELSPVYWLGPIYEVRRGSWFYQEGSTLKPCDENLAAQLEEGYLQIKPFRYPKDQEKSSFKPSSLSSGDDPKSPTLTQAFSGGNKVGSNSQEVTPKA